MSTVNHIKARIEVECQKLGVTMAEIARRTGRSPQALQDILKRGNPTLSTLREIADAMDVEMDVLIKPVTAEEYGEAHLPKNG